MQKVKEKQHFTQNAKQKKHGGPDSRTAVLFIWLRSD